MGEYYIILLIVISAPFIFLLNNFIFSSFSNPTKKNDVIKTERIEKTVHINEYKPIITDNDYIIFAGFDNLNNQDNSKDNEIEIISKNKSKPVKKNNHNTIKNDKKAITKEVKKTIVKHNKKTPKTNTLEKEHDEKITHISTNSINNSKVKNTRNIVTIDDTDKDDEVYRTPYQYEYNLANKDRIGKYNYYPNTYLYDLIEEDLELDDEGNFAEIYSYDAADDFTIIDYLSEDEFDEDETYVLFDTAEYCYDDEYDYEESDIFDFHFNDEYDYK